MRTKFNGILTLFLALIVQISFAQDRTISGTVSDETGPLPGVTILKKGTTQGTETDFDGNYSINAKTGDVLVFSFVGMKTAERTVGSSNSISLVMEGDNLLEEVVVVGYGTTTKQSFTGTAKVVKTEDIEAKSVSNVSQALAGEVAGVTVVNTSGQPGSVSTIRIRGIGSVNGNSAPLYVVDGVPFGNTLNSINPADIESTTVLKDATATAIYGSRGANGVILITTKKGKAGKTTFEVDIKTGVNSRLLPTYETIQSPERYAELSYEALRNTGELLGQPDPNAYAAASLFSGGGIHPDYNMWNVNNGGELIDPATGKVRAGVTRKYTPENWSDYGYQTSIRKEANLKMSGGTDKTTYFSSFGFLDDQGYLINSDYKRYSTRLNLTHKPTDWIKANANIDYSYGVQTTNGQSEDSGSIFWFADNIPTIYPLFLRNPDGSITQDPIYGGNQYDYGQNRGFGGLTNAIADANYDLDRNHRHAINGNFSFIFDITEGLSFETKYAASFYSYERNAVTNPFYGSIAGGGIYKELFSGLTQNFLNMLRYNKSFGDHSFSVLAAHESNQWERDRNFISKQTVVNLNNGLTDLDNYINESGPAGGNTDEYSLESYFGQLNYDFKDKYYLSAAVRRDGSSRFFQNKWGTFWSVGGSWIVSKEDFMTNSFFDFLKVKASYGVLGDQAGVSFYAGQDGYDIDNLNGNISLIVRPIENRNITWESSNQFQTGLEFGILNNRIEGSFDYYRKSTTDLIFEKRLPPSSGDALITVNDGELLNNGYEFDVTAHLIEKENFKLDFTINGEVLNTEITQMPFDETTGGPKVIDIAGNFGRSEGHGIYDYYMPEWAGVDPATGDALWFQNWSDANTNGIYDSGEEILDYANFEASNPDAVISERVTKNYSESTQRYVGKSAIPDVRGAFRLSAESHGISLSAQFAYGLGGYSYDGAYAGLFQNRQAGSSSFHKDIENRWQNPGDVTNVPRIYSNQNVRVTSASTRFLTKSDYLALNNIRLGYNVPSRFLEKSGISALNLWVSGDNLFLASARKGFNPTTNLHGGSDVYRYSPLSTFAIGVRVKL